MVSRRVCRTASSAASATADAPSYIDAFEIGRPVSSAIIVWNSKVACRTPCATSGWYGV